MNLRDILILSSTISEDLVLYAKKIDGHFLPSSEAVLLELTEKEKEMKTDEVAKRKCPGFSYCMEMFLIHAFVEDLDSVADEMEIAKKIDRIIYYIEYDA